MQDSWSILLRLVLAFGLAVAGGAISISARMSHKRLCCLISLAAGTLLGVTLFSILPESYAELPIWQLTLGVASGYLVFALISRYVFHVCPACAASHFDEATTHRFSEIATALVFALAIHSALDGLALAAGHEVETDSRLSASLLLAICIHKIPEGLALGALLLGAGYRRGMVLIWVAAVEVTTLFGGILGLWVLPGMTGAWIETILAHVGGGFIFLAVHAVSGELLKHSKKIVLASFSSGLLLIAALNIAAQFI